MNQAIVGTRPDQVHVLGRGRERIDHATMLALGGIKLDEYTQIRRHARILARRIGTDDLPTIAAISGFEQHVGREIQDVGVDRREHQWRGAVETILPGTQYDRRNVLSLAGDAVEFRRLATVDEIWVQWIGRNIAIFLDAHRIPIPKRDFTKIASAGGADTTAFLLPAVHPVGELIVGDDVIELRGWLVVPRAPGLPSIHADGDSLIDRERNNLRIVGIDPDGVIIVASRRSLDGGEIMTAVVGTIGGNVGDINRVLVFRIDTHTGKVVTTPPQAVVCIYALPTLTGIIRAIEAPEFGRIHQRVDSAGIVRRNP